MPPGIGGGDPAVCGNTERDALALNRSDYDFKFLSCLDDPVAKKITTS